RSSDPTTITLKLAVDWFPAASVVVQTTTVVPMANVLPELGWQPTVGFGSNKSNEVTEYVTGTPTAEAAWTEIFAGTVNVGAVLSIFTVTKLEPEIPTPFIAEHVIIVAAVSESIVVTPQPLVDVMPDSGSNTVHVTVTLLRYQPLFPAVPEICEVTIGGVISL